MTTPGFIAEASVYKAETHYRGTSAFSQTRNSGVTVPAYYAPHPSFPAPMITATYTPPGLLTIEGQYWPLGTNIWIYVGGVPQLTQPPTVTVSEEQVVCLPFPGPYGVFWQCNATGKFTATVPYTCVNCMGTPLLPQYAEVTAVDMNSGDSASTPVDICCPL
jgi:hypothetical protein